MAPTFVATPRGGRLKPDTATAGAPIRWLRTGGPAHLVEEHSNERTGTMAADTNVQAQERLGELVNAGELDKLDEVFASGVVDNDPAPNQGPGPQGFKDMFTAMRTAFPDLKLEPATLVTDDEHVALAYTITGTHDGDFQGVAPTGKQISVRGMQIGRFEDGKIVERWGSSDELGIMRQIGAVPDPA